MIPIAHFPERPLQPPEPTEYEIMAGEAHQQRQQEAYSNAFVDVMCGRGAFWHPQTLDGWDNEQAAALFAAVRDAVADERLPSEARWRRVLLTISTEGSKYAASVAERTE